MEESRGGAAGEREEGRRERKKEEEFRRWKREKGIGGEVRWRIIGKGGTEE